VQKDLTDGLKGYIAASVEKLIQLGPELVHDLSPSALPIRIAPRDPIGALGPRHDGIEGVVQARLSWGRRTDLLSGFRTAAATLTCLLLFFPALKSNLHA